MSDITRQRRVPEKARLIVELNCGNCAREIGHNPLEQAVVHGKANKQLELVVFA